MVGVPRSTGCHLCIKRRVKCDQSRPGCGNCAKYGADCPGYDKSFKFVAGKHHVRQRRQQASKGASLMTAIIDINSRSGVSSHPNSAVVIVKEQASPSLTMTPSQNRSEFVSALLDKIEATGPTSGLRMFTPWFNHVTQNLGKSVTLDCAMSAMGLQLLGKAWQQDEMVYQSRCIYGHSLGFLQKALNHSAHWKSSETLCATMLLCFFELFAGTTDTGSWMQHASGVSRLIQQRGPAAYKNEWDWAMLHSFRPLMIMNCMFSNQECFLARKRWEKLLNKREWEDSTTAIQSELDWIHDDYMTGLARMPDILRRGSELRMANNHNIPIDAAQVAQLSHDAEKQLAHFMAWYPKYNKLGYGPSEEPSKDPGSIYDTVLVYSNVWAGSLYMGYWASVLILQESLNQCRYHINYAESNRELVRNIFRSVECVAADVMGPFRVGYAIRIAYEFADVRTQTWLTTLLEGFQKRYAATSPDGYPKPAPNEFQYS